MARCGGGKHLGFSLNFSFSTLLARLLSIDLGHGSSFELVVISLAMFSGIVLNRKQTDHICETPALSQYWNHGHQY